MSIRASSIDDGIGREPLVVGERNASDAAALLRDGVDLARRADGATVLNDGGRQDLSEEGNVDPGFARKPGDGVVWVKR